jgi:hypothetical protein
MDRHASEPRMSAAHLRRDAHRLRSAWTGPVASLAVAAGLVAGCAHTGLLQGVNRTVTQVNPDSTQHGQGPRGKARERGEATLRSVFGDTLIGLVPSSGDTTRRYLGRLRDGYTADTLNVVLMGDNRPTYRLARLDPDLMTIKAGLSPNPIKFLHGLITIPIVIVKSVVPDLALFRDLPAYVKNMPTYGREHQVMSAILAKIDSLHAQGKTVAAVVNSGDLVFDGRDPRQWTRFLRLSEPLTSRVPYFPVAGNHERIDTPEGMANWATATGLPASGDRLYYCFDTADRWLRFICLDTNPIVDPTGRWTRELQVKYSDEEFTWLVARIKEHVGPVVVLMHHPPFSSGEHRMEWQADDVLKERRERMVKALHEAGISIIVSGHEHGYQRALLTWPDAVLVAVVTGGGGAPLHLIPDTPVAAGLFGEYKVAGSVVKPENVFTARVFNYTLLRLWFGGGELFSYAVDAQGKSTQIDRVKIDLTRYGVPKVDQHKIPVPPAKGPSETKPKPMAAMMTAPSKVLADSTVRSEKILSKPPPGKKTPLKAIVPKKGKSTP